MDDLLLESSPKMVADYWAQGPNIQELGERFPELPSGLVIGQVNVIDVAEVITELSRSFKSRLLRFQISKPASFILQ